MRPVFFVSPPQEGAVLIKMIVARSENGVIGNDGQLPWRLKNDMSFFRNTTLNHTVVMGRKTFESIGKPLPKRMNLVLTRQEDFSFPGVRAVHSVAEATAAATGTLFVIGGEMVYRAFLPLAKEILMTVVHANIDGDAYFPELSSDWTSEIIMTHPQDAANDYAHTIYRLHRA